MAYPHTRSMNRDLFEGMTDGGFRKVITNRGGDAESTTYAERAPLYDRYYGIHETPLKPLGDGRTLQTENYVPTPKPDLL